MANIYNDLKNSGQTFLYVFISPKAKLPTDIMQKRADQLAQLSEMYSKDQTYTPTEMIDIIRQGIVETYGQQPEDLLQVIFNVAVWTNKQSVKGIGDTPVDYNLMTDQYGNIVDLSGKVLVFNSEPNTKVDFAFDTKTYINTETNKPFQSVDEVAFKNTTTNQPSTFWKDVQGVIDWIVGLLNKLGIGINSSKVSKYSPTSTDWAKVNSASIGSGLTDYLPVILGAGMIIYIASSALGSKPKQASQTQTQQ